MIPNIVVDADSLDRAADELRNVAADLRIGQFDLFLLDWAAVPHSHAEVAKAIRTFAEFAHGQYRDTVALMSMLSALLAWIAADYRGKDTALAERMTRPVAAFMPRPSGP